MGKNKTKDQIASLPVSTSTPKKDHLKNSHPYTFEHLHNAYITSLSHLETMPVNPKKRKSAAQEETESAPINKRGKGASGNAFQPSSKPQVDADGNQFWEIAKARRVTISEFKGKTMVGIREYYEKDDEWLPGKKGISMSIEQYSALIQIMPQVEELLKSKGEKLPRPNYDGNTPQDDDRDDEEEEERAARPNIDATSDEDE